ASLSHPCQRYLFAFRLAGSDAVNQQVDLNVAGQQIQYRLRDANVSFDSTDDHLLYVLGIEPALEVPRSARTEAHFFYYRGIRMQVRYDLVGGMFQALRILLGDDHRYLQHPCALDRQRDPAGDLREVRYYGPERFLHVDYGKSRVFAR